MGESPQEEVLTVPDARAGRGRRFGEQLSRPFTLIVAIGVVAVMTWMVIDTGNLGGAAIVVAITWGVLVRRAWRRADKQSRDAFFFAYAESRKLEDPGLAELPPVTSLLRAGDHRQTGRLMAGKLGDRETGFLAHFVYEEIAGSDDSERIIFHDFTVVLIELAGIGDRLGRLHFQARSDDDRKADRHKTPASEPLHLESVSLDRRYQMSTAPGHDQILLRRIFAPSFIVWLAEQPPDGFGFELEGEWLCCYVTRLLESGEALDELLNVSTSVAEQMTGRVANVTLR